MYSFLAPSGTELQVVKLCIRSLHLLASSCRWRNYVYVPCTFWHRVADGETNVYVHCTFWHRVAGGETMYTFIAPSGTELQVMKLCIRSLVLLAPSCRW